MTAIIRSRYLDEEGRQRLEYALNRKDGTSRYGGPADTRWCSYCNAGLSHSRALHTVTVAEMRKLTWRGEEER
jgi:hypothetical protein